MNFTSLTCRVCGTEFLLPAGTPQRACPACGTEHSRPRAQGVSLECLRRAHQQRAACDFANAERSYQRVLSDHPDEAEALWGLALCKYGVEYIEDDRTHERRPVVHFLRRCPITEDPDFRLACARAGADDRARYEQDAEYISRIQQAVLAAEGQGEPFDIFLCYKASVPGGKGRTREFDHARDLYYALRDNHRIFFAHETLTQVAGANYEARIFHALHTAKVLLLVCSTPDYLSTPWVRSEWSRFLERLDAGDGCRVIPLLFDGCDPYALPDAFVKRSIQGLRMDELTSLDNLRRALGTLSQKQPTPRAAQATIYEPIPAARAPQPARPEAKPAPRAVQATMYKAKPATTPTARAAGKPAASRSPEKTPAHRKPSGVSARPADAAAKAPPEMRQTARPASEKPSTLSFWSKLSVVFRMYPWLTIPIVLYLAALFTGLFSETWPFLLVVTVVPLCISPFIRRRGAVLFIVLSCAAAPGAINGLLFYSSVTQEEVLFPIRVFSIIAFSLLAFILTRRHYQKQR